jgi:hypothetical protein
MPYILPSLSKKQRELLFQEMEISPWHEPTLYQTADGSYRCLPTQYMWKNPDKWCEQYEGELHTIKPMRRQPSKADVDTTVTVDKERLHKAIQFAADTEHYNDVSIIKSHRMNHVGSKIIISTQYNSKSGRLWSPIQSVTKIVRASLFPGYYDYDLNAAMPTLFYHVYPYGKYLRKYLDDKERIRRHIMAVVDCSYKQAKQVINCVFFGAKTSEKQIWWLTKHLPADKHPVLAKMLGVDVGCLLRDDWFSSFTSDVSDAAAFS